MSAEVIMLAEPLFSPFNRAVMLSMSCWVLRTVLSSLVIVVVLVQQLCAETGSDDG